jgi:hypothetical protein
MVDAVPHSKVHGVEIPGVQNGDGVELQPYTNQQHSQNSPGTKHGNAVLLRQSPLQKNQSPRKLHVTNHGALK